MAGFRNLRGTGIKFRNQDKMNKEVKALFNLKNKKNKKLFSTIVIIIIVLAMVLPMVLGALMSIF